MAKRIKGPGNSTQAANSDELLPEVSDPFFIHCIECMCVVKYKFVAAIPI